MSMSIQTNVNSLVSQENLRVNSEFQGKTIERLTSGYRINSSADDAAGLAVSNKFRSDTTELTQGVRNANDGISQLQIIDGGLNNISKMLDRMKTLATQSASATFTGSRTTLNTEFSALIGEITRQASNVGLNSGGTFNKNISTYIGGASTQSNAQVSIDLAGTANAVDAVSLGISGASVLGGGNVIDAATDLNPTNSFMTAAGSSQTFTFSILNDSYAAQTVTATVTGDSDGITVDEAMKQLNSQLSSYGISATTVNAGDVANPSNVNLAFAGSRAFSVTSAAEAGGGAVLAGAATTFNKSTYNVTITGPGAAISADTGLILTNVATGQAAVVKLDAAANRAGMIQAINDAAAGLGMQAVASSDAADTTSFTIQSNSKFTLVRTGTGTQNLGAALGAASGVKTVTGPASGTSDTGNALSAISAIQSAVATLGKVQGTIGASQNKLAYAINLAQSQITNFSAAESRIRDADVASEAANLTKAQVLTQASMAAMAQANSAPQQVLSLLRG